MKKLFFLTLGMFLMLSSSVKAQNENGIFDHLAWGVTLGTTGIGIDVAAPVTDYLAVRAGYSFMPKISPTFDADFDSSENWLKREDGTGYYDHTDIDATLKMNDFKLLVDVYPFKQSGFHLTAGAYIGSSKLIEAKSVDHFINESYWGIAGPELGSGSNTYTVVSDDQGVIHADVKVNSFKPYLGIGFGRAVPKGRVACSFDMGVQFWGKPAAWTTISDDYGNSYQKVDRNRITNDSESAYEDIRDGIKTAEKIFIYPTLTFRICGRIF